MDIDRQILELEGRNISISSLGSKTLSIKAGVSLIISIVLLYIIRPYYLLSIEADPIQQKCVAKIKYGRFSIASILGAGLIFLLLQRMNIFTE